MQIQAWWSGLITKVFMWLACSLTFLGSDTQNPLVLNSMQRSHRKPPVWQSPWQPSWPLVTPTIPSANPCQWHYSPPCTAVSNKPSQLIAIQAQLTMHAHLLTHSTTVNANNIQWIKLLQWPPPLLSCQQSFSTLQVADQLCSTLDNLLEMTKQLTTELVMLIPALSAFACTMTPACHC